MSDANYRAPPGWIADCGTLEPDRRLAGYKARAQGVSGLCAKPYCRRRCTVEIDRLIARGMGGMRMAEATAMLRCHRIEGCELDFTEDKDGSYLPLRLLQGFSHVGLNISCSNCRFFRKVSIDGVIAKLEREKKGGPTTCVTKVVDLIRGGCKQCGKDSWRVGVIWPSTDTIGWRAGIREKLEDSV